MSRGSMNIKRWRPTKPRSPSDGSCHPEAVELENATSDAVDSGPNLRRMGPSGLFEPRYSKRFVLRTVLFASIGGLLFGYDTGIISGALILFGSDLGHTLSSAEKQLVTSITSGGAFVGALIAALTADSIGRKMVIGLGCIWFTVGSVVAGSAYSVLLISIARFVIGLGLGIETMITPVYIAELAPSVCRGRMITIYSMAVTGGQFIAYGAGSVFANVFQGWRWMFALGAIPALLQVALLPLFPETPRHLIYHSQREDAFMVLQQIYPYNSNEEIQHEAQIIQEDVNQTVSFDQGLPRLIWSLKQVYFVPSNLRSVVSACGLMAIQQLCGFNSLMYYSATLFSIVGFSKPVEAGLIVSGTNFLFTIVAFGLIDRGRRRILVNTMWGLPVALVLAAVAFTHIPIDAHLELEASPRPWAKALAIFSLVVFVAFYATGLGAVPWMANELMVMEVRAVGTAMLTMVCWACNIIVAATFLSIVSAITASGAFGIYAGLCLLGWLFVIVTYPETAGLGLESIREVFKHRFGVGYSRQLHKRHRAERRLGLRAPGELSR